MNPMFDRTMPKLHPATARIAALALLGLAVAGCAAGAGWAATLAVVLSFGTLALSGCSESHDSGGDSSIQDAGRDAGADAGADAGGTWHSCCVDGVVDTCLCPPAAICNYESYRLCPDGTCHYGSECDEVDDAGVAEVDAGGQWEPCCQDGVIESCFCPAGAACNYGLFNDCGDGTCVFPSEMCPAP